MDSFLPALQQLFEADLAFEYTPDLARRLAKFYQVLTQANQGLNLTRITSENDFYERHILDAWALFKVLPKPPTLSLMDLGTGGGIPGIPLWLVYPQWDYFLVDSVAKKLKAIDGMIQALAVAFPELEKRPHTCHARAEDLGHDPQYREKMDCVVARALAPLPTLLEYALPLVKRQGLFIAMKSINYQEELTASTGVAETLGAKLNQVCTYTLPDRQAVLLVYQKVKPTHKLYPRDQDKPRRQPLSIQNPKR